MRRPLLPAALSAILTASLLAACGGDDDSASGGMSAAESNDESTTTQADEGEGGMDDMEMNHDEGPPPVAPGAREIELEATSFEFDPSEIDVQAGEDVAIALSADDDVEHDFVIDELDTHISAPPGETVEGGLRVDEPGRYTFYCSVSGHRDSGMEGTLVVS